MITAPALLLTTFILLFAMLGGRVTRKHGAVLVLVYFASVVAEFTFRMG